MSANTYWGVQTDFYNGSPNYANISSAAGAFYTVFTNANGVVASAVYADQASADAAIATANQNGVFLFATHTLLRNYSGTY